MNIAMIIAGGSGQRMGQDIPKQFLTVNDRPVIIYTLEAFELLKDSIVYVHVKDALWENGKVVPAGYGDGNVKVILDHLFADGFNGFLSLEPHLFEFKGLAELEKGGNKTEIENARNLTGFEAFSLAHESLMKIL